MEQLKLSSSEIYKKLEEELSILSVKERYEKMKQLNPILYERLEEKKKELEKMKHENPKLYFLDYINKIK